MSNWNSEVGPTQRFLLSNLQLSGHWTFLGSLVNFRSITRNGCLPKPTVMECIKTINGYQCRTFLREYPQDKRATAYDPLRIPPRLSGASAKAKSSAECWFFVLWWVYFDGVTWYNVHDAHGVLVLLYGSDSFLSHLRCWSDKPWLNFEAASAKTQDAGTKKMCLQSVHSLQNPPKSRVLSFCPKKCPTIQIVINSGTYCMRAQHNPADTCWYGNTPRAFQL